MRNTRTLNPAAMGMVVIALAVGICSVGCTPQLAGQNPDEFAQSKSKTLVAGTTDVTLPTSAIQSFEVSVGANQDIEVVALPRTPAVLGIGFAVSPDGREFTSHPGAEKQSGDGRARVERRSLDEGGAGFRFTGTADAAGLWRFSILVLPQFTADDLWNALGHRTFAQATILWLYMLNNQSALGDSMAALFFFAFPDLVYPQTPLDVVIQVATGDAGDFIDPGNTTDPNDPGGSSDPNDAGDPNSAGDPNDGGDPNSTGDPNDSGGGGGTVDKTPPASIAVGAIVATGDAVPEQDGATFVYFGDPIIDDEGRVAFYASYTGGAGSAGVYVWESGVLKRVIDNDPAWTGAIPGLGADDKFGGFKIRWDAGAPHMAWGSGGRLLFATNLNNFSQANAMFRWRASDEDLLLVSDAELMRTAIPDSTSEFIPDFYHPGLSDNGVAIFSNRYSYFRQNGSFALFERGAFTTNGSTTTDIIAGSVPGQPTYATFADMPVLLTTHNGDGDFLFQARYQSPEGDRGVYLLRDGNLSRVIDNAPNRIFTGLLVGTRVGAAGQDFDAIAISAAGHIAVDTTLTFASEARDTILRWDGSSWGEFATPGNADATDLLSGINDTGQALYLAGGEPQFGDNSKVVSLADALPDELVGVDLTWPAFGGAVSNLGRALLHYERTGTDDAGVLFWSGAELFVVIDTTTPIALDSIDTIFFGRDLGPADLDRVGTLNYRPEVNRPGVSGPINDRDQWVFRVGSLGDDGAENTSDDQQAIFLGRGE